jgi:hypothetical protein
LANNFLKTFVLKNILNIPGWRTDRKLLAFESDDWGSIRMPSNEVFENLSRAGIDLTSDDGYRYNKFDSLETYEDLTALFDVLCSVKDYTGRYAVFTPASIVANPDFTKIRQSDFQEYFYEPFTDTLKRYPHCGDSFALWREGIDKRLFVPQFHGREHLNICVWMRALRSAHYRTLLTFENGMWGISTANDPAIKVEFQAAYDFIEPDDLMYQNEVIVSGLNLFEKLFGYRATYFVPPNSPFSTKLENVCFNQGIKYMFGSFIQTEPLGYGKTGIRYHWLGQKRKSGLTYLTRNCLFEPDQSGRDWVDNCLYEISVAFKLHKPAVVSTHRVNYIGALYKENRESGLKQLKSLLKIIIKTWPETEFITSAELGEIIIND